MKVVISVVMMLFAGNIFSQCTSFDAKEASIEELKTSDISFCVGLRSAGVAVQIEFKFLFQTELDFTNAKLIGIKDEDQIRLKTKKHLGFLSDDYVNVAITGNRPIPPGTFVQLNFRVDRTTLFPQDISFKVKSLKMFDSGGKMIEGSTIFYKHGKAP